MATITLLVTKKDLQIELAPIKADLNLLKWMMGALIALAIANEIAALLGMGLIAFVNHAAIMPTNVVI